MIEVQLYINFVKYSFFKLQTANLAKRFLSCQNDWNILEDKDFSYQKLREVMNKTTF